ncbi:MAG: tripartite tricarboxylate transporter substrate binding protein [Comamonas sp.]
MTPKNLLAVVCTLACTAVAAQSYPSKPITLLVGFPPGGGADSVARVVSERLGKELGQPIVVENKPGAGTTIASDLAARAAPDGYTLLLATVSLNGSDQLLYKSVRYDGSKSFTPITQWAYSPMLIGVREKFPEKNVSGLVEHARKNPGKLSYSSSGAGVITHLAGASFENAFGIEMLHVPYKGGAPSIQAVAAGDVDMTFGTPPSVLLLAQAGKLRLLGVTTAERSPLFPDLPSMKEAGLPDFNFTISYNVYGPAGMPDDVVKKIFDASTKVLNDPEVKARLEKQGNIASPSESPAQFKAWAAEEGKKYLASTQAATKNGVAQ